MRNKHSLRLWAGVVVLGTVLASAGAVWAGDLPSVDEIEHYEKLLNETESFSFTNGTSEAVCQQLLLAADQLSDLYKVLGDEAYADAKNSTIGFDPFGNEASSLFCFDDQVKTLLDEELCLLRGRKGWGDSEASCRIAPCYNRLTWNYTRGVTAGEAAYAANYSKAGVGSVQSTITEEEAAARYPWGHGDGYGHYLSAMKYWYRLIRNPNFDWKMAKAGETAGHDYAEEAKFARAAADVAKTAADVVDVTVRVGWRDNYLSGANPGYFEYVEKPFYLDPNPTNAFGYGEWASRGGCGALANWVVANSLLPAADPSQTRFDRGNTEELAEICESAEKIMRTLDRVCGGGVDPRGLFDSAIPFDTVSADGTKAHFEQARDRATTALTNAHEVLARAQTQSSRKRMIEATSEDPAKEYALQVEQYDGLLLSYCGSPYSDDIGEGKTYPEGYAGADLYHYLWMDLAEIGLDAEAFYDIEGGVLAVEKVCKPASITGRREHPGKVQEALMSLMLQYQVATTARREFEAQEYALKGTTHAALMRKSLAEVLSEAVSDRIASVEPSVVHGIMAVFTLPYLSAGDESSCSYTSSSAKISAQTAVAESKDEFDRVALAYSTYNTELTKLTARIDHVRSVIAEAKSIFNRREAARRRQASASAKQRYDDVRVRRVMDTTLLQYAESFDLAQKYAFMAAQLYDYETGVTIDGEGSRDEFKEPLATSSSLGAFDSQMQPKVANDGDFGLVGHLAQMNAKWLDIRPKLGLDNPETSTTWFSFRRELFRIYGDAKGDKNWKAELKKYWTDDIRQHPVCRRYCQEFQSPFGPKDREPGFIIPFSTTIDLAKNLFGNDIVEGEHAYDPTLFLTRIASAGVWFDGYNEKTAEAAGSAQGLLAENPTVYLVQTGPDSLRALNLETGLHWQFSVLDCKQPMFRAYYGEGGAQPSDNRLDAVHLAGRSVWNDRWYLIIPAGALNADRDQAMDAFLNGLDTDHDGKLDIKPVTDIKIGIRTYSQSDN